MTAKMRRLPQLKRGGRLTCGRGRIQVAARRAAGFRDVLTTTDVAMMAYARKRLP